MGHTFQPPLIQSTRVVGERRTDDGRTDDRTDDERTGGRTEVRTDGRTSGWATD